MKTLSSRLAFLCAALLLALAAPSVFGQAAFLDFNTPGQFTNSFGVRNRTAGQAAVWHETNAFGVGNSRALEGVTGSGTDNTLTYLGDAFPFPTNEGASLNLSVMFRAKPRPATSGTPLVQLGFLSSSNAINFVTNSFMEGNSAANWMNLRLNISSAATNLQFEYGTYITANLGAAFTYASALGTAVAVGAPPEINASFTNWYKLTATFTRGPVSTNLFSATLQDMGVNGLTPGATVMTLAPSVITNLLGTQGFQGSSYYAAIRSIEASGVDNLDNFAVWMTNGAARVTAPPTSQSISTYRSATFVAKSDGTPPMAYTWYTNGVIVGGGATNATYTTPVFTTAESISVYVAVTNAIDGADSSASPATLTVTADGAAPSVVSVGSVDGKIIGVAFTEAMDPASATTPGNYFVTGGTVTNAALRSDGRVALTLSAAISGAFTVTVSGVTDLAGNALSVNNAASTVLGLTPTDVGAPLTTGSTFSSSTGDIDQSGGGLDFFNLADQGHFAGGLRTGDFDIRVRVQGLQRPRGTTIFTGRDEAAQASIVAKENFEPGSRMVRAYTTPLDTGMPIGSNNIGSALRTTILGAASTPALLVKPGFAANGYFPNMWLRLRRVNNTFTYYYGTNVGGADWIQYGQSTATMTPSMVVGPATFPRTDEYNIAAAAQYRSYGDWSVGGAALGFHVNLAATTTINITAPVTNGFTTLTVTATNTGTLFPSNEIQFVWQRSDGAGGFTNIPNAGAQLSSTPTISSAAGSYTTPALNQGDHGAQFRVIARGPGGLAAISAVTTVIVNYLDTTAPAVTSAWIPYLSSNALTLNFNVPLDITTVSNLANYRITNSLGQLVTITGVIFEQGAFSTQGVTRVVLLTSTPLTNGPLYSVVFTGGLRGTNGTPIVLNSLRTVGSGGTVKVELWDNLANGTITNDFLNQAKVLSNFADYVFFTNTFSYNHNGAAFGDPNQNNYGGRISAWFIAPSNGVYRFHIRNDDPGQLYFNPNGPDPLGKITVAYQAGANANYGNSSNINMTANFILVSNQAYYIEGIWKEATGGDGFGLTFREQNVIGIPATGEIADGRFFYPIPTTVPGTVQNTLVSMTNVYPSAFNVGQHGIMGPARIEIFTNSGAGTIATFTNSPAFLANTPHYTMWTNVFGFSTNLADTVLLSTNYGGRLSAYFVAPSNGFYRFYLKSDDGSSFAINTNGTLPSGKSVLASLGAFRNSFATNDGSVTVPISLTNGQWYYIEGLWAEGIGGDGLAVTWRYFADFTTATNSILLPGLGECMDYRVLRPIPVAPAFQLGYQLPIQAELYTGIVAGTAITDLTQNPKYQGGFPDFVVQPGYFGFKRDLNSAGFIVGNDYGARISAYFVPPTNGFYRFYLKNDDSSQIFMNTSGPDYSGRTSIASLGSFRNTYLNTDGSMSAAISLTNGTRYYMEVLFKEGGGGDGVGVAMRGHNAAADATQLPAATEFIPYTFFAPITGPVTANNIVQSPTGTIFPEGQVITFSVNNVLGAMPIGYQWKKNGVPIPGAVSHNVNVTLTNIDNGVNTYSVVIYNPQSATEKSINLNAAVNPDNAPPALTGVVGNGLQNEVTVSFSESLLPSSATNTANYSIAGLTITAAYLRSPSQVALLTSPQTAGARYTLVVNNVRDLSRFGNQILPNSRFDFTSWDLQRGFVTVDLFTGINNNTFVNALVGEPKFIWNTPDQTQYRPFFGFGSVGGNGYGDFGDNYGARVYGWFIAPSNGNFRFYIRSDDQSELFMNTNAVNSTDPAGKVGIAGSTLACCGATYSDLSRGPVISPNITLAAGQMYYMEALFKEGGGGDGVAVAFREAGDPSVPPITETIPGYFFASLGNPDLTAFYNITTNPVSVATGAGQRFNLTVGATAQPNQFSYYQWQLFNGSAWVDVRASTNIYGTNFLFSTIINTAGSYQYRALASVPGLMRTSSVATVTVTNVFDAVPTGPILTGASTTNGLTVLAFFHEAVTAVTATNPANYLLTNHLGISFFVTNATILADARTVVLNVSTQLLGGNLSNYTLVVSGVVDVGDSLAGGGAYTFYVPDGTFFANLYQQAGVSLNPFPSSTPSASYVVSNSLLFGSGNLNGGTDAANPYLSANLDSYVARLSGFIIPPSNGLYQFWSSSDDGSQFFLNTNSVNSDSPTGLVQLLAPGAFNAFTTFTPTPYITMRAGQRYYFEGRLQEGGGGDAYALTMREIGDTTPLFGPSRTAPPLTASNQLSSLFLSSPPRLAIVPVPSLAPAFVETATNTTLGLVVGSPAAIQWYSNNVLIAGATNTTYTPPVPLPLAGANFQVIATNYFSGVISNQFAVTVTADATAPYITGIFRDSTGTNIIVNFSELVNSVTATALVNFALSDGGPLTIASVRLRPDGRSVIISLPPSGGLNPATGYTVTVSNVADRASVSNVITATTATTPALAFTSGFLAVDLFTNLTAGAGTVAQITNMWNDARFINNTPDLQTTLGSLDYRSTNFPWSGAINYGAKIYGWFMPPATATYRFYWRSDDSSFLFMNTNGATPSGKVQIGGPTGAGSFVGATSVSLTMGTAYYIEWNLAQGAGAEYFQATWRSFPNAAAANTAGFPISAGTPGWPAANYPSAEVAAGADFGVYGDASTVSNLTITLQPTPSATNVGANTLVNFSVGATNDGANRYLFYQWQADDGGGNFTNLSPLKPFTSDYAMLGNRSNYSATFGYSTTLRVVATLPGGLSVTSSPATVTVTNEFNFFTAGSVGGTTVTLVFDKPLEAGVLTELSTFTINDGSVSVVSQSQAGRTVTLNLSGRITGNFTVTTYTLPDVTLTYLTDAGGGVTVNGAVVEADFMNDVGSAPGITDPLVRGSAVSLAPNSLDITAGGSDIFGTADGMYYVARQITGNFDVRMRVAALTNYARGLSDPNAKAAITARVSTNGNSRMMTVNVAPPAIPNWPVLGTDRAQFIYRDLAAGSAATANNINTAWTNGITPWLRLMRVGALFNGFYSRDGTNWQTISSRDTSLNGGAYPDSILVGFAASSHNNTTNVTPGVVVANLRDIYFPVVPTITVQPDGATNGLNANLTMSVTATNPANSGPLTYQWRRNGVILNGANASSYSITGANVSDSGAYTVLVANDGGGVLSSNAMVLITNALPTVASETIGAVQNVVTNYTAGTLLANNTDPEGRALSIAQVSGVFPVTFYTDFEAGLPAGTAVFGAGHVTNSVGVTNSSALVLTDAVAAQAGAFIISNLVPGRSVSAFSATFQARIGGGSGNPADGMSFNIASDLPTAGTEEGVGSGLSICLDNYDNGNLEAPSLGIKWRGVYIANAPLAKVASANWLPVSIVLRANGTLDVTLNGVALFSNLQTPYTPVTGASFGFYARTGGEFETHWLDEVAITVLTPETSNSGLTTSYASDFAFGLPQGLTLYGFTTNAYWTNRTGVGDSGALHLNDAVGNASGAAVIDEIVTNRPVYSFTASFKLRIASGAEGADGMSFNFANDLPNAVSGGAEEGVGTGLSLCFDVYRFPDNTVANRSGLKLKYRGNTISQVQTPVWNSASYIPVVMTLTANGLVTVNVNGTNAFANIPTGYQPARGRFGFYSRTGGANETHWIDDLNIVLPDNGYVTLTGTNVNYFPPRNACGTDTFYYQVSDGQGGLAWDSATVQLLDVTPPLVVQSATNRTFFFTSCSNTLPDLTLFANSGLVVTDACTLTLTQSPLAGTLMGTGIVAVTITAVDASTNLTVITTYVTNRDNTIPAITCPANVAVLTDVGQCYASGVVLGTASATDNCLVAFTNNAPSVFPVGVTIVTYTAVDIGGNTNACQQIVTVTDPAAANVAAYEPFVCYPDGSLFGQTVRGPGFLGSWVGVRGDVLATNAASLIYNSATALLGVEGGRAFTPAAGFNTAIADMNTNTGGAFSALLDGGRIGGPNASGTLYFSFLARNGSSDVPNGDTDFAGVELFNDGAEVLGIGNNWTAWAYSLFGSAGDLDLTNNSGGIQLMDNGTHLFVVRIDYVSGGNDNATVWMDPNIALGEGAQGNLFRRTLSADLAFNRLALRSGSDNNDNSWDFDEIRFGSTWGNVTPSGLAITASPASQTANCGSTVNFTVTTASLVAPDYRWSFNGSPVGGATNATLPLLSVSTNDVGSYSVIVSNRFGSLTSSVATLTVTNTPLLISPAGPLLGGAQDNACGSLVLASGSSYRWELTNAAGSAGLGWDVLNITGGLDVQSTSGSPFAINLWSLSGSIAGLAANFNNDATNVFTIATVTDAVTNFSADKFALNDANFSNDLAGGVFTPETAAGALNLRFTPNHAPVALSITNNRAPNLTLKFKIADLLANATSDADGDARALTAISATSTNGVALVTNATHIFYTNPNNVEDEFTYTVRDVRSYRAGDTVRTATGTIRITVNAPGGTNFNAVAISFTNGVVGMRFAGIPGYAYDVQRTTNLTPPVVWSTLWTTNAPPLGLFDYIDLTPPVGAAFYRTAQP